MRRIALLAALCLLAGACGGDDTFAPTTTVTTTPTSTTGAESTTTAATTSTTEAGSTSTTEAETTTSTYPWETYAVPEADLCVIEHRFGESLNVRSGPGTGFEVIGTLPYDQTGMHATGVGADDDEGQPWKEIDFYGTPGWVAAWLLTNDTCLLEAPADYCVIDTACTDRLNVRSGPGGTYQKLGSLPFDAVGIQATGATSTDGEGRTWRQIRFRGDIGWVASWLLTAAPCSPWSGEPCTLPSGPASPGCVDGWITPEPGSAPWNDALEQIGVGGPWSEIDPAAFVVDEMRYCTGPEDVNIISPRPIVERWYIVGYAETDPAYRGRWLVRRTGIGFGLAAVAPYDSTGFGSGVWEACPDGCHVGPPLAGQMCEPACVEDYIFISCEGIAPGTWAPGDCAGPPPEVLGCFQP